jgi:predicted ATPase
MQQSLWIQDVRCFKGAHRPKLAPITLLVGENSTGKSTLLAICRLARELTRGPIAPNFNSDPFLLGAYEQIAHYHGGQGKRASEFVIGCTTRLEDKRSVAADSVCISATFRERSDQPVLSKWSVSAGKVEFDWKVQLDGSGETHLKVGDKETTHQSAPPAPLVGVTPAHSPHRLLWSLLSKHRDNAGGDHRILAVLDALAMADAPMYALSPIRSRPERTYDPMQDVPTPEGRHVPMTLKRLSDSNSETWARLRQEVSEYGTRSGLIRELTVRRKGKKGGDPFQIQVKVGGQPFNLIDVGYGVSQVLPILVDCTLAPERSTFLVQQPEVHLHPRAQAELGTFFAALAAGQKKTFIIETHSDYLIDRLRSLVRPGGLLRPEQLRILYFARREKAVEIHEINFDEQGNMQGQPDDYRAFFLQEQKRLLFE